MLLSKPVVSLDPRLISPYYKTSHPLKNLRYQLAFLIGMLLVMIILGGATRLTGSGLSIVEWKPITGIWPPLDERDWQKLFLAYKKTPEYLLLNKGMDLSGFKSIFWLEFIHRLWGRLMGIALVVPLVYSFIHPTLKSFCWPLLTILILGGLQGGMGWIMVKSGLGHEPYVNPLLLTGHLALAVLTYGRLILLLKKTQGNDFKFEFFQKILISLLTLTMVYGALVAGHKAGLIYNEFPFMGGRIFPEDFGYLTPMVKNFFLNPATIQWTHRVLGLLTLGTAGIVACYQSRYRTLFLIIILQVGLGITTLLLGVPLWAALLHQVWAFVALGAAIIIKPGPECIDS